MATADEKAAALAAIAAAMEKKHQERTGPESSADGGKEKTQPQKGDPRHN
ncbi:hypothetical protein [Nocardiopsis dassonvillei]